MGWRDEYTVHPAADVFPMMSDEELAALGANILENGLREPIKLLRGKREQIAKNAFRQPEVLLDGRNRLEAMERAGIDLDSCALKAQFVNPSRGPFDFDAVSYVISLNIHRRHLSKQDQADLIVAAIKAGEKPVQAEPVSDRVELLHPCGTPTGLTVSRETADELLNKGGRGKKNPVKEKAVAEAKKFGISEATVKRSIAKAEGKTPKPKELPGVARPAIVAVRKQYLALLAELPFKEMEHEVMRTSSRFGELLRKAEKAEDAHDL